MTNSTWLLWWFINQSINQSINQQLYFSLEVLSPGMHAQISGDVSTAPPLEPTPTLTQ